MKRCHPLTPSSGLGRALLIAALAGGSSLAAPGPASAAPAAAGGPKAAGPWSDAERRLLSREEAQIRAALDDARMAGPAAKTLASSIAKVLARGLDASLSQAAIETLGDLESDAGTPVLALYAGHRNLTLRRAAVKALARTKGAAAVAALRRALSDADPAVRASAALGLGALDAKDAAPDLLLAVDHRVNEAVVSLGQVCAPELCKKLTERLGKMPLELLGGAIDQILFRANVPAGTKIEIIGKVRDLATIEANKFLREAATRWPAKGDKDVRAALDAAVAATAGASR